MHKNPIEAEFYHLVGFIIDEIYPNARVFLEISLGDPAKIFDHVDADTFSRGSL